MGCAYILIRYRHDSNRTKPKLRGIPTSDDGMATKDIALRLPATSRQIHAETRLLIFSLATFMVKQRYQFRLASKHVMLRNIKSLRMSTACLRDLTYFYPIFTESQGFEQASQPRSDCFTKLFPRLTHLELAPRTVDNFHCFDHLDPYDDETRSMKGAEFYRRLLEQRIRDREGRPLLTFSWK